MGGGVYQKAEKILDKLPEMTEKNLKKIEKGCTKAIEKIGTIRPRSEKHLDLLITIYSKRGEVKGRQGKNGGAEADFTKANEYRAQKQQSAGLAREDSGSGSISSDTPTYSSSPKQENIPQLKQNNAGSGGGFAEQVAAQTEEDARKAAALARIRERNKKIDALEASAAQHEANAAQHARNAAELQTEAVQLRAEAAIHKANAAKNDFWAHSAMFDSIVERSKAFDKKHNIQNIVQSGSKPVAPAGGARHRGNS